MPEKHYVFSARTTEEGLKALNAKRTELKVGWDDFVVDAINTAYDMDVPKIPAKPVDELALKAKEDKAQAKADKAKAKAEAKAAKVRAKAKADKAKANKAEAAAQTPAPEAAPDDVAEEPPAEQPEAETGE